MGGGFINEWIPFEKGKRNETKKKKKTNLKVLRGPCIMLTDSK